MSHAMLIFWSQLNRLLFFQRTHFGYKGFEMCFIQNETGASPEFSRWKEASKQINEISVRKAKKLYKAKIESKFADGSQHDAWKGIKSMASI